MNAERYRELTMKILRNRLIGHMRTLAETLTGEADRLEAGRDQLLNSFGVVQSQGSTIDNACGAYCVLRDMDDD